MLDKDELELHWNQEHTAYTCVDMVEIIVKKSMIRLEKKYLSEKGAQQNQAPRNRIIGIINIFGNRKTQQWHKVPQNGIIYECGSRPRIIVSETLFNQSVDTCIKIRNCTRTYAFPDTVLNILQDVFKCSKVIKAVKLSKSIKRIDIDLFRDSPVKMIICATELENVDELLALGDKPRIFVFASGIWLKTSEQNQALQQYVTLVIPQDMHEINYLSMYKTIKINKIQILPGSHLEKIGNSAFARTDIREFIAPPSLREVGCAAFINCWHLEHADLAKAEKIGGLCFWGTNVQPTQAKNIWQCPAPGQAVPRPNKLVLPDGMRIVEKDWFNGSGIKELFISQSVEKIEEKAFEMCENLTKIVVAEDSQLKTIGQNAFAYTRISEFAAPPLLESIGTGAFRSTCLQKFIAPKQLKIIGEDAFEDCKYLRQVVLNDGLETLGNIFLVNGLDSIILPKTLKQVLWHSRRSSLNIRVVWIEDGCTVDVKAHADDSVAVFGRQMMVGNAFLRDLREIKRLVLPETIETIGKQWFMYSDVENVTIPASVQEIETAAFRGCKTLKRVRFVDQSKLKIIRENSFYGSGLEEFNAPRSLKVIEDGVFRNCKSLKRVVLNEDMQQLGREKRFYFHDQYGRFCPCNEVFRNSGLEEIVFLGTKVLNSFEPGIFYCCNKLKTIWMGNQLPLDVRLLCTPVYAYSSCRED